jgi:membrane protein DedA with SNARE-associated domain
MHVLFRHLIAVLFHLGAFGLVILGILDSSFLFLPVGNDLLLVVLVARHHGYLPLYVLAASLGSATGVLLLDLACRKGGEEGLQKMMSRKRLNYLKKK